MNLVVGLCVLSRVDSLEIFLKDALKLSGQKIKSSALSKKQLECSLSEHSEIQLPIELLNWREICPTPNTGVKVIEEDSDFLSLHKPQRIHTHPHGYETEPNLIGWMASQESLAKYLQVNKENYDRGALWRLDLETSGVVVIAKHQAIYDKVRTEFSTLVKKKYYLALVTGRMQAQTLNHCLIPSEKKGRKMAQANSAVNASLVVTPILEHNSHTVLLIELHQGIRHQIRAQLSLAGYPILGDELYEGAKAQRLFLHCLRYEFSDKVFQDKNLDLFGDVVDLNRLLQVLSDMGL